MVKNGTFDPGQSLRSRATCVNLTLPRPLLFSRHTSRLERIVRDLGLSPGKSSRARNPLPSDVYNLLGDLLIFRCGLDGAADPVAALRLKVYSSF